DQPGSAQLFSIVDHGCNGALGAGWDAAHQLGAHADGDFLIDQLRRNGRQLDHAALAMTEIAVPAEEAADQVHRWRTDEIGNEKARGAMIDFAWLADLFDNALVHDDQA